MDPMQGFVENFAHLDARQFTVAVRKLADGLAYGIDKSPYLGSGVEYVQSRPYQEGDNVRAIDWRVTARTGKYHVKEYEAPKCLPTWFLIDTSASMTISSSARSKYETALFVAGGLALACLDRVSPVGVVAVGERGLRIQPSLSRAKVMQWLLQLRHFRYDEGTRLGSRVAELAPSLSERALVVVLSDLHDEDALPAMKRLAARHDVVALQFVDPAESGLAGAGFFRAREAESGREFVTRGKSTWSDPARAARELPRAGIDYLAIHTNRPYVHALRNLFRGRDFIGRGTR
jgi:uncharacterized protein (DUF58 family)